ncbi:Holliday junction resolvase RuvX [Mycoplasmoides pirum]|uniref:Holliday junction resolvase RuvX n=1 Tax=Mycoplasmoides pirum TaxID=2122 RepID=UPI000481D7A2|nr:Holliday junction resolvase RuvX [Mycoplasmoides pirum]
MYFLGLDVGSKTLGVAICHVDTQIPSPLTTIRFNENNFNQAVNLLKSKIKSFNYEIKEFIIGWPINENGTLNKATERVEKFVNELIKQFPNCKYKLQNERYTTKIANEMLFDMELKASLRSKNIDKISAVLILEFFLNEQR